MVYSIEFVIIADQPLSHVITKRFSSLRAMHKKMSKVLVCPKFPPRTFYWKDMTEPSNVLNRTKQLLKYYEKCIADPKILGSDIFLKIFELPEEMIPKFKEIAEAITTTVDISADFTKSQKYHLPTGNVAKDFILSIPLTFKSSLSFTYDGKEFKGSDNISWFKVKYLCDDKTKVNWIICNMTDTKLISIEKEIENSQTNTYIYNIYRVSHSLGGHEKLIKLCKIEKPADYSFRYIISDMEQGITVDQRLISLVFTLYDYAVATIIKKSYLFNEFMIEIAPGFDILFFLACATTIERITRLINNSNSI